MDKTTTPSKSKTKAAAAKSPPPAVKPEDVLLTVAEVAALDKVSERSVRAAINAGLLKTIRIGPGRRMVRITKKAHEDYRAGR